MAAAASPGSPEAPSPEGGKPKGAPLPMVAAVQKLQLGEKVAGWEVVKKLGEGGFGAVYKVKHPSGRESAMKIEACSATIRPMKMEVVVLQTAKKARATHFCELLDAGKWDTFNFLVMTLVGPSLHDLRKAKPKGRQMLSLGCAISVSIQCLKAIQQMHGFEYLHRDIKPPNFAVGLEDPKKIVMLDFGMARKFTEPGGQIREPRQVAAFRGTGRYAPLSAHLLMEQCRKDDLEMWLYLAIEMTTNGLPWKHLSEDEEILVMKNEARTDGKMAILFGGCPREYVVLMKYIDQLQYRDLPHYEQMVGMLRKAVEKNGCQEYPWDWQPESKHFAEIKLDQPPGKSAEPAAAASPDKKTPSREK